MRTQSSPLYAIPEPDVVGDSLSVLQVLPSLEGGGVERGAVEVANALAASGNRSLVMSAGGPLVAELRGTEHVAWPIGGKRLSTWKYVGRLQEFLEKTKPDILHARSRLPAWVAYLAWQRLSESQRPHFLTTAHGLYSVSRYSSVMARGEHVIAVSNTVREYLLEHYCRWVRPDQIKVIPRGVDSTQYRRDFRPAAEWTARWRGEHPTIEGRRLVVLPARLTRLKGHHDFIGLIEGLLASGRPVHGLIVGGEDPRRHRYASQVRAEVRGRNLESHITFLGHRNDLREILSVADLTVSLSSKPESFGRVVLESLALNTPVIGYAHGGVGELLETLYPAGKVAPGDRYAATQAAANALDEPECIGNVSDYRLDDMLRSTLALYRQAVGNVAG